jgi:hypothetical protein
MIIVTRFVFFSGCPTTILISLCTVCLVYITRSELNWNKTVDLGHELFL